MFPSNTTNNKTGGAIRTIQVNSSAKKPSRPAHQPGDDSDRSPSVPLARSTETSFTATTTTSNSSCGGNSSRGAQASSRPSSFPDSTSHTRDPHASRVSSSHHHHTTKTRSASAQHFRSDTDATSGVKRARVSESESRPGVVSLSSDGEDDDIIVHETPRPGAALSSSSFSYGQHYTAEPTSSAATEVLSAGEETEAEIGGDEEEGGSRGEPCGGLRFVYCSESGKDVYDKDSASVTIIGILFNFFRAGWLPSYL